MGGVGPLFGECPSPVGHYPTHKPWILGIAHIEQIFCNVFPPSKQAFIALFQRILKYFYPKKYLLLNYNYN
jgi:hypothetical protein